MYEAEGAWGLRKGLEWPARGQTDIKRLEAWHTHRLGIIMSLLSSPTLGALVIVVLFSLLLPKAHRLILVLSLRV